MIVTGSALDVRESAFQTGQLTHLPGVKFKRDIDLNLASGLAELRKYYELDSYVMQSINKYTDIVLKDGIGLVSGDPEAAKWLAARLWTMAVLNNQTMMEWFRSVTNSLLLYANVFLLTYKTRAPIDFGSGVDAHIAGFIPLPTDQVRFVLDKNNRITGIYLEDKKSTFFASQNNQVWPASKIIHLHYNRPAGGVLGVSQIFPVLEDIRMLRMLEDVSAEMVYKNINPLVHAKVGLGPNIPGGPTNIREMQTKLANMNPHKGFLVTNQFTELGLLGAESQALRPEGLLRFFRERVLAGLGVSEVSLGNVSAGNRAATETVSGEMKDRAEAYRECLRQLETSVFLLLLIEGGFSPLTNPAHRVYLKFSELDPSERIKKENQVTQMYVQGVYGWNEARAILGLPAGDDRVGWEDTLLSRKASLKVQTEPDPQEPSNSTIPRET